MKLAALHLRQRDGVTCGPSVAVVGGALLDAKYRAKLSSPESRQAWFASEQLRVHTEVNRIWPRMLGTTPMGIARALSEHGAAAGMRYRWRLCRGRRDNLSDVLRAVNSGLPVAMLIGRFIPRHWVLFVDVAGHELQCYEPSSGEVRSVAVDAVRRSGLTGLGYPRPFALVLPRSATRSATT
jgi:hypothetical protein